MGRRALGKLPPDVFQIAGHFQEPVRKSGMDHHDRVDVGRDGRPVEEVTVAGVLVGTSVSLVTKRQDERQQTPLGRSLGVAHQKAADPYV